MPSSISNYLISAVITGLTNIGDRLDEDHDDRWHAVAGAAALLESHRSGHTGMAKFVAEAARLVPQLRALANDPEFAPTRIAVILGHAQTTLDGLRFGFVQLEDQDAEAPFFRIFAQPRADHPMLEVRHA